MRKIILIAAAALSLGGCATVGGVPTPVNVADFIAQVRATAAAVCSFEPTAQTVADIIASGNPIVSTVDAIANAICTAVAPAKAAGRLRSATPTVAGVVVHGKFFR